MDLPAFSIWVRAFIVMAYKYVVCAEGEPRGTIAVTMGLGHLVEDFPHRGIDNGSPVDGLSELRARACMEGLGMTGQVVRSNVSIYKQHKVMLSLLLHNAQVWLDIPDWIWRDRRPMLITG